MNKEPPEPPGMGGLLKQLDHRINLCLDLRSVRSRPKSCEDLLWSGLRLHVPAPPDMHQHGMQLLNAPTHHSIVVEQPLGALAQVIDILPAIVLHVCRWFPVTHLAKDAGDLLELSAHSSTPTHFYQEEYTAWEEQRVFLVYLSSHQG